MRTPIRKLGKFGALTQDPLMTADKFSELKQKLNTLYASRPQAAKEVSRLAELGDFSENVEYQLAKSRLRGIHSRILTIENQLKHAEIIEKPVHAHRVEIGHTVTVEVDGVEKMYQILGSSQSDPTKGIISHNSPIGSALLGKKAGERVQLVLGGKEIEYKIIEIH